MFCSRFPQKPGRITETMGLLATPEKCRFLPWASGWETTLCREPDSLEGRRRMRLMHDTELIPLPGCGLPSDPSTETRTDINSNRPDAKKPQRWLQSFPLSIAGLLAIPVRACGCFIFFLHNFATKPYVLSPVRTKPLTSASFKVSLNKQQREMQSPRLF